MQKTLTIALIMLSSAAPSRLLAKGATTKVVIEGPDLSKSIEITDRGILTNFNVWAGPGTFSTQPGFNANAPSFIVDWSQGPVEHVPAAVQKYQVSFYSEELSKHPIYVVYYAVARSSESGYVYLPGKSDEWWGLNVRSIVRGVEGNWFHAWSTWERVARPIIEKDRNANEAERNVIHQEATRPSAADGSAQIVPASFVMTRVSPDKILKPDLQILLTPDQWGAQISPDSKKLVFTRSFSGTNEVWISDINGSNLLKLSSLGGPVAGSPQWSPDGKWVAFDVDSRTRGKIFIVSVNGGPAREIAPDNNSQHLVPNWSRDGKWIYFASDHSGDWQVWKAPFAGGEPMQVTHQGGFAGAESPDGAYVYYSKHRYPNPEIWRVAAGGDTEELVSPVVHPYTWADWSVTDGGIYFLGRDENAKPALQYFDFARGSAETVARLARPSFFLSVSNDAHLAVCASY